MLLAIAAPAAGCGDGGDEATAETARAVETAPEEEPFRVGLVTDARGLNDRGVNSLANKGLQDAILQLGVEGRVLESRADADYVPNLAMLAEEGFDLVISVGFPTAGAAQEAARQFPGTSFAVVDFAYEGSEPNLQGILFREQEAGYLAGFLAALVTDSALPRTNSRGVVSTVGSLSTPSVTKLAAGFEQGARAANPAVETLGAFSRGSLDEARCRELALEQIAEGSDVVFQVDGGCAIGALEAAGEEGVWGIGVDSDQAFLGEHVLTSALKRADVAVFKTIEKALAGEFVGGTTTVFGLAEDGVGLGQVSPDVPPELVDAIETERRRVVSGEVVVSGESKG